jgi:hypothetical protein
METAGGRSRDPGTASTRGLARPDWRMRWSAPPRTDYTSETKPFFLTSEFLVFMLFVMGLAIGTSTADDVDPRLFWILTTAATCFYMLSRGIAKSGSRSRAYDPREDLDVGRGDQ